MYMSSMLESWQAVTLCNIQYSLHIFSIHTYMYHIALYMYNNRMCMYMYMYVVLSMLEAWQGSHSLPAGIEFS